ncbi:hypothetical protein FMEAI12_4630044 [Parafrankia sp. Ea1.12]|nr:hypothetical protein FMEAI12_4630044 [Parafrankia sp. Ea1.12]
MKYTASPTFRSSILVAGLHGLSPGGAGPSVSVVALGNEVVAKGAKRCQSDDSGLASNIIRAMLTFVWVPRSNAWAWGGGLAVAGHRATS